MEATEHIDALEREAAHLVVAASRDLDAAVAACPGWTTSDLLGHVGTVYRWAAGTLEQQAVDRPPRRERPDEGADMVAWLTDGLDRVVHALRTTDPDTAVWGWAGDGRAQFWSRRMAHETTVHRVDAELATGTPSAIAPDLAADGIDELVASLLVAPFFRPQLAGGGETIHVHRTDGPGEWLLRLGADGLEVSREHAKGDVAVRGAAADLLLLLWNRTGPELLEVHGDETVLDRWRQLMPL